MYARLVDLATEVPILLQVPKTREFLEIYPILAAGGRGFVGQERVQSDERNLESRYIHQNSVTPAPVKRYPVYTGEDLYFDRFPSYLDHHVRLEKIPGREIERRETEFAQDIEKPACILTADRHKYIEVAGESGESVDANGVSPDDHVLNSVLFE